ncbi:hypothetical protein AYI68_g3575 [Smittium mucronatum]|uniref:Endonuclease/exonuclease/phosphatase domain-containing protein n=1 Tax=Smittium mucronatum TaxID=133383 RepID=A0A1R0GZK0_9FUNG|nr:hypothetical protein AYI68_g3575 [Smittium mucronatum]
MMNAVLSAGPGAPEIHVYNVHFECFTGISGRLGMMHDLVSYVNSSIPQTGADIADANGGVDTRHLLVFGDMNTLAHSIARLSPLFCTDWYRITSLFVTEPEFWYKYLFPTMSSWTDPFDPAADYTISNHLGFMRAKVDWTFVNQFHIKKYWMLNNDFSASDHKLLALDLDIPSQKSSLDTTDANSNATRAKSYIESRIKTIDASIRNRKIKEKKNLNYLNYNQIIKRKKTSTI